jgi:hypothetical protein
LPEGLSCEAVAWVVVDSEKAAVSVVVGSEVAEVWEVAD